MSNSDWTWFQTPEITKSPQTIARERLGKYPPLLPLGELVSGGKCPCKTRDHSDEFPQREKTVWAGLLKGLLCCRVGTWSSGEMGEELGHFTAQLRGRVPLILHAGGGVSL